MKGKVKWFNGIKGFGFIEPEEGSDVFVHQSALDEAGISGLDEGDEVEFETEKTPRGLQAVKLKKL